MSKLTIRLTKNKEGEIKEQHIYNEDNLLIFYFLAQRNFWIKYYYDNDNRLIRNIDSNNMGVTLEYNKNIITKFSNGQKYGIYEYNNGNCTKKIIPVSDDYSYIRSYQYDDEGNNIYENHKCISDGHIETMAEIINIFDSKNNLISSYNMKTNNIKIYKYKYDDKNNIIEYVDNKNNIFNFEYDDKNRKIYAKNNTNKMETFYEYIEL